MTALRDWLKADKLDAVADALEAADIDLDILPELSEADLAELGLSLGNRRRLLKAIAERGTAPAAPPPPLPATAAEAERRQVTVAFCDLAGSTALSTQTDPEILGGLLRRYQDAAAGAIGRFGGFVAKFMGDGVLAYFGFPQAYEDAAERAVRAALTVIAETGAIAQPNGRSLQARIGIATGLVVVGELIGSGTAQERTIVGETPNLAARLQALAALDTILIADATRNLLGGRFELILSGPHEIKGLPAPVTAWRVVGEAAVESRFAAARQRAELPLLGRDHEMALLRERWRLATTGEGQIVTVIGEGGIGKSRLIEALQEQLTADPHGRIHLQCSPYHTDSALYPMIQGLARGARFAPDDSAETKLAKLAAIFPAEAIPLAAELMSLPAEPSPLTPARRKDATIRLLIDRVLQLSEADPVLLVLEDAHWIDATTLELMTRLADSIGSARVLALVTGRPDFAPPWQTRPHATLLTLGRLARADCARLVADVAAAHGLTAETVAAIVAKTDGVPLFVEELTRSVVEQAGGDGAAVPATLQDSLMARLDRLGLARETAQIAAVIGRDFPFALLRAATDKGDAEIETSLANLVAAGIVFPQGRSQDRGYSFKHALVRDAAYESLLLSRRRDWHARVARALEAHFADTVANEPEVLAQHFAAAGLTAEAGDYRLKAGDRAVSRSAYREAIAHYNAGIAAAEKLSDADESKRRQLTLLLKLGPAYTVIAGAQSPDCERIYRCAAEIGVALHDDHATYRAKWGLWLNANLDRKTAQARDRAAELIALARQSNDGELLLEGYHCGWSTAWFRGDLATTRDWGRIGIETYDIERHRHLGPAFGGHDPGVCAHACSAQALRIAGERDQAVASAARALMLGEALDHPFSLAHALYNTVSMYQLAGDRDGAEEIAERMIALAEKYGFQSYLAGARLIRAWTAAAAGGADAVAFVERSIEQTVAVGPTAQQYLGIAGEVMMSGGRYRDALAFLDRGIEANEERDVGFYVAEIYRLRGICLLALDRANKDEARAAFVSAKEIAQRQGAIIFVQRAEAALADL
jgi:class 3 adenylate cyclase/tetratricopeptide (TPR) repeat protein